MTPKPFQQFLIEQRKGALHAELSEGLQELVTAVAERGRGGSLTLSIRVSPAPAGTGQYIVTDDVKVKSPEADRGAALWFAVDGNLSRSHPNQPELPLQDADANLREVK